MVEPCEEDLAGPESSIPQLNPLGSYQWKGQNRSVWNRFQDWRTSFSTQHKPSTKKQLRLFKKSKPSSESKSGSFARYLGSISLPQKRRKKNITESFEVTEERPTIPPPTCTPDVPVWDVSNFSLVDGCLVRTKGEEQDAYRTRSRAGSCVSNADAVLADRAEADPNADGNADIDSKNQDAPGLISKRKKKHKKKTSSSPLQPDERSLHGSHESLGCVEILDLTTESDVIIRALHSSILGEQFCFEVITSTSSRCFGCSSVLERDRWIENLRRIVQPDKDNFEREESSLSLWIHEAKGLPNSGPGSRALYFCEVHIDGSLYGRTSSKAPESGVVFWGESFNLKDLPSSSGHVALHLLREGKEATGVGTVTLVLEGMRDGVERWVPLGGDVTLRLRGRYRKLCVLPLVQYKEFAEYLAWKYLKLSRAMEPILSAREKEELGRTLIYVLQSTGQAKEFLVDLGTAEITRYDFQESLIFRENTIVTKAIEEYMKMVGQTYLQETLGPFVSRIYASTDSHEVDPLRCSPEELNENKEHLWQSCEEAVQSILESQSSFPPELLAVFSSWQEKVTMCSRPELGSQMVSACLFLRFLCPAILSPGLFHLSPEHPNPLAARALTLVAKVLQNLANFTRFGEKEDYMAFMNGFLEQYWDGMSVFLQTVTDPDSEVSPAGYEGSIDLAYELATLHYMLCGIFKGVHQQTKDQLEPLPTILKALAEGLPVPEGISQHQRYSHSQEDSEEPEFMLPKDMRNFRPLVKKCQSLSSLMREQMVPLPRIEEREKKSRRHVTRTQSVPAQSRPGRERRTRAEASSVAGKDQEENTNTLKVSKRITPSRPSSTLPRRKSTVPWCRDEDHHLIELKNEEGEGQERHLQEMRGQIAENLDKQKDLEGQILIMAEKMQEVTSQLAAMEATCRALQAEMTEQTGRMQKRIDVLEKNSAEKSQKWKNEEQKAVLENHLSSLKKKNRWKRNEITANPHREEENKMGNDCESTAIVLECAMTDDSDSA
ncbi:PREDICTED: RAS protein activator like-3 [Nanorana parkeri]|uniref:RAS protein activator like-3 n=1 Tax=Nanorana parkeri TaxID=125878 RepID=UPI00085453F0|nr:PREDICTED: RAS protein activator like-3 [Nanorana parkeri]